MMKKLLLIGLLLCFSGLALAEEDNLHSLDIGTIVITPSRIEEQYEGLPQNVSVVTKGAIEDSGATSTAAILDRLPSVNIIDYGSDGTVKSVHTRGLANQQVLTLINGLPAQTPRDGLADLNKIDLNNIERIEVLRGPASSIYGASAMGGVINIITRDGKNFPKTMLKSKYGLYDTRQINFAHGQDLDIFDYYLSHDTYKTNGHRQNSDYEYHNTNLKLGYTPRADNRLTFGYGYYQSELGSVGKLTSEDLDNRQESWRQNLDITWKADLTKDSNILLKAYHNVDRLDFIWNLAEDNVNAHQSKGYGADLQFAQKILDTLRFSAGYNRREFRLNSSSSGKHSAFLNAFYCEGEGDLWEKIKLYFGARYDDYSNFGDRISPSARFSWWLDDNFKLHGLYAHSFRAPTFNDLYWPREDWGAWVVEGNTSLSPEKAESYEFGISTYFFKAFWTDLTYFRNRIEDLIKWTSTTSGGVTTSTPENIASAITQGVELNSDFVIWERLKANFNYTLLYAKDKETKKWLEYRPRHQYKLNLNYRTESGWTFDSSWRYLSKRFTLSDNLVSLGAYWVTDLSIAKEFLDIWEFQISASNLFDRDYEEQQGYPMPGTQILTSLKCEF
jgi:outer membrane cobalamin receptor